MQFPGHILFFWGMKMSGNIAAWGPDRHDADHYDKRGSHLRRWRTVYLIWMGNS
jgi:hypothetical protein